MTETPATPTQLGPYPIEREIGRGGMGIVYLGRDTRLDRPVALKVLPDTFALDPERLARFEREARLLASLNHSNIAGIYGIEESRGLRFLALEFVEGDTLSVRLGRGPLPVDEALEVCRQIAAALEAAHENGVIHRDLKPGNVKITGSGEVKVLDFGLAKGATTSSISSDPNISQSPTMTFDATGVGVILGTAAYMSPEQARGRAVDKRTDIWSFGCVLFECLTGRQAFAGETVSDTIALILQGEPAWHTLPARLPESVRSLLRRCLEKDAKKRMRDIGDARIELEHAIAGTLSSTAIAAPAPKAASSRLAWGVAAVFALATVALGAPRFFASKTVEPTLRLSITAPEGHALGQDAAVSAVSPDGTMLAFVAYDTTRAGRQLGARSGAVWVRRLDSLVPRRIPDTEGVFYLMWSPDSRYIAFFTQEKLKKVDLLGGSPENLCDASIGRGGSWGKDGVIVFAPAGEGRLYKVSANGGVPEQATVLDSAAGETGHRFPQFLPDGRHFVFVTLPPRHGLFPSYVGSLDSPDRVPLVSGEGAPLYAEPSYLLYVRNERLVAQHFNAKRLELSGEPVPLGDEPAASNFSGNARFSVSTAGVISYLNAPAVNTELAWFDGRGQRLGGVAVPEGRYDNVVLSRDGERAVMVRQTSARESDLWVVELNRGTASRFTFMGAQVANPIWSPDGSRIVFSSDKAGTWDLYEKRVGGAGAEVLFYRNEALFKYPLDWSPDGKLILFEQLDEETSWDLWTLPVEGDHTPELLVRTPFDDRAGQISPDGRWFVYQSAEAGRNELYVQAFPTPGRKVQVTKSGGSGPFWRSDGRQIVFGSGEGVMLVDVDTANGVRIGEPRVAFQPPSVISASVRSDFKRFLGLVASNEGGVPVTQTVVLNWVAELEAR